MQTMPQAIKKTTSVRMAVARLESTPSMPTLARMDVSAAKTADRSARMSHIFFVSFCMIIPQRGREYPVLSEGLNAVNGLAHDAGGSGLP